MRVRQTIPRRHDALKSCKEHLGAYGDLGLPSQVLPFTKEKKEARGSPMATACRETIKELIEGLVSSTDLTQLTAKSVRKHVRDELGDGAGDDSSLKPLVRELIDEVLSDMPSKSATGRAAASVKQKTTVAEIDVEQGGVAGASSGDPDVPRTSPPDSHSHEAPPHKAEDADAHQINPEKNVMSTASHPFAVKRKRMVLAEDDELSEDASAENTCMDKVESRREVSEGVRENGSKENRDGMSLETGRGARKRNDRSFHPAAENSRRNGARPLKTKSTKSRGKSASNVGIDSKLQRILRIARELGCPVPPSRLRCDMSEKVESCNDYLKSKGVGNVLLLDRREIATLRQKLEQEKELAGLDASNILNEESTEGGRRPRRAAAPPSLKESHSRFADMSDEEEIERESDEEKDSESDFEDGRSRHETDSGEE